MASDRVARAPAVYLGVDLGTSRSAMAASNRRREVVDSYVGWPVDDIARKRLQREVLVGAEALEHRAMLDLRRPLERGVIKTGSEKDLQAVGELLRHLVELAVGDVHVGGAVVLRAVVGAPAAALRVNRQQLRDALRGLVDAVMVVSEPFAVAYGVDALVDSLIVDVGAGTADLCLMRGRYPRSEDQRTLAYAGDWVDERLHQAVLDLCPQAEVSVAMARRWKERHGFVGEPQERVIVRVEARGEVVGIDITQALRTACESLLAPLVEATLDLVSRVEPGRRSRVRQNVILAGGSGLLRGLGEELQSALHAVGGGRVRRVKDVLFAGANGCLALAADAPDEAWERLPA